MKIYIQNDQRNEYMQRESKALFDELSPEEQQPVINVLSFLLFVRQPIALQNDPYWQKTPWYKKAMALFDGAYTYITT